MRQKSDNRKPTSERVVKDIRRATRKQYSAEEKIRIVLDGLRGEHTSRSSVGAKVLPRAFITTGRKNSWRLASAGWPGYRACGDQHRGQRSRRQAQVLKEVVAEQALEFVCLKKA